MASALALLPKLSVTASSAIGWKQEREPDQLPTSLPGFACPRGRITEIAGPVSSGRATLVHRVLAAASQQGEYCATVDPVNAFDPHTAATSGVDLDTVVWVRCSGNLEHAMKSADLLVHSGGFGVIHLDLCDVPTRQLRRIPISWWYRFRRAIENTATILLVTTEEPQAKASASLLVELTRESTRFDRNLYSAAGFRLRHRKPINPQSQFWSAEPVTAAATGG